MSQFVMNALLLTVALPLPLQRNINIRREVPRDQAAVRRGHVVQVEGVAAGGHAAVHVDRLEGAVVAGRHRRRLLLRGSHQPRTHVRYKIRART